MPDEKPDEKDGGSGGRANGKQLPEGETMSYADRHRTRNADPGGDADADDAGDHSRAGYDRQVDYDSRTGRDSRAGNDSTDGPVGNDRNDGNDGNDGNHGYDGHGSGNDGNGSGSEHDAAWLLLPWLANGTLDGAESRQVEAHVDGCERCRHELERCQDLAVALRSGPETAPTPHPIQLSRLMARIDALAALDTNNARDAGGAPVAFAGSKIAEPLADPMAPADPTALTALTDLPAAPTTAATPTPATFRSPGARSRLGVILAATPRPVRFALAAQLAALLVLALALSFELPAGRGQRGQNTQSGHDSGAATAASSPSRALFHTLSAPSGSSYAATGSSGPLGSNASELVAIAPRPQIRLVFSEQATEKQIREVLIKVRGRLVDGPSPLGTYTIEIPAPPSIATVPAAPGTSDAAAARQARAARPSDGAPDSLGIVLAYLTAQPIVRFAEPVAGMASANPQALLQP